MTIKTAILAAAVALAAIPAAALAADGGRLVVAQAADVAGKGVVKKVDAAKSKININHDPIPAIKWGAMTMDFQVENGVDLNGLQPGQAVDFTLAKNAKGTYVITSIKPRS